jgi:hypothetical protein
MTKEFLTYELTLKLKEVGFNEPCMGYYDCERDLKLVPNKNKFLSCEYAAPLYQEVFRWFREKHNMLANVYSNASGFCYEYSDTIGGTHRLDSGFDGPNHSGCWDSYEEAEIACILKLIETIKNK